MKTEECSPSPLVLTSKEDFFVFRHQFCPRCCLSHRRNQQGASNGMWKPWLLWIYLWVGALWPFSSHFSTISRHQWPYCCTCCRMKHWQVFLETGTLVCACHQRKKILGIKHNSLHWKNQHSHYQRKRKASLGHRNFWQFSIFPTTQYSCFVCALKCKYDRKFLASMSSQRT